MANGTTQSRLGARFTFCALPLCAGLILGLDQGGDASMRWAAVGLAVAALFAMAQRRGRTTADLFAAAICVGLTVLLSACGGGDGGESDQPVTIESFQASAGTFVVLNGAGNHVSTRMDQVIDSKPGVAYQVSTYLFWPGQSVSIATGVRIGSRSCLPLLPCESHFLQQCGAVQDGPGVHAYDVWCSGDDVSALVTDSGTYTVMLHVCTIGTGSEAPFCTDKLSTLPILLPLDA